MTSMAAPVSSNERRAYSPIPAIVADRVLAGADATARSS
jgi:hypothetical protein